jgi:hypothetical protein
VKLDAAGRLPNVWYTGLARVVLKTVDNVQVWERDEVGSGSAFENFGEWQSFILYDVNDYTYRNGLLYRSITNANQGNDPASSPGNNINWEEVRFLATYTQIKTYAVGDVVRTSDGALWRSVVASNINNEPSTDDGSNWQAAIVIGGIAEIQALQARTTTAVVQAGGGTLTALRVNTLTDSNTYTLPLANSVSVNQWIDIELESKFATQLPTVNAGGADTIEWQGVTDTSILFNAGTSIALRLYSDGVNKWRF